MRVTEDLTVETSLGSSASYVNADGLVNQGRILNGGSTSFVISGKTISGTTTRLFCFGPIVRARALRSSLLDVF